MSSSFACAYKRVLFLFVVRKNATSWKIDFVWQRPYTCRVFARHGPMAVIPPCFNHMFVINDVTIGTLSSSIENTIGALRIS